MGRVSARHSPVQNHLLAALPPEDYERLLPDLAPVALPLGWIMHGAGERQSYLYFVTQGIVCEYYVMENGKAAEFALTGSEGVIGLAAFLGGDSTPSQAVVVSVGYAYRLGADRLKSELEHNAPLRRLLLSYTGAMIAQIGQSVVCNRHHALKQRLCCWILQYLDRVPSNKLAMTHDFLAHILGVRREGVTQAATALQEAGAIQYFRGHITVLDRSKLEAHVCECYGVVKREYDRLLRLENTIGNAGVHSTYRLVGKDPTHPNFA
ncbi:MAG: Crp/Fnr family transcriptional regulator [Burkholderiales bacterium]